MKTPHKHAELIIAWANGAEIETRYSALHEWYLVTHPVWKEGCVYRIKPEPKPDVVELHNVVIWGRTSTTIPNIKLTFDGETGQLKTAEVI